MFFFKGIRSFRILMTKQMRALRIGAPLFCLAIVLSAGVLFKATLVRCYRARVKPGNNRVEAAVQAEPPAPPPGLSRQRKGFDDAIATLKSAANQNQHLAAYYKRVVKRTGGQEASVETATAVQASVSNQKRESPIEQQVPATASLGSRTDSGTAPAIARDIAAAHDPAAEPSTSSASPSLNNQAGTSQIAVSSPASCSRDVEAATAERSGLVAGDISFDLNPAIDHWVHYYTATPVGRSTMQQGLERCGAYLDTSRAEFRQSGLPEDLVWVAQVESVWKQGAKSPVAAGGIWQFMPRTATDYGLVVGSPGDERFDPAKETRAAASYLRDLHTLFGNWELALAAYNCGEPRLMDAIVRAGQPDFWALYDRRLLPKETCNYVPKILAAIKVVSAPESYGFTVDAERTDTPTATPGS